VLISKIPPILATLNGSKPSRKPVWFMRQAGRYLPEYQEIRKKHSMLEAIRTPSLASEITLQPLRRFDFDAAIIFADILNPLIGMGIELDFIEKEGPKIFNPIKNKEDILALKKFNPLESIGYTLEAIEIVKKSIDESKVVLGFSGAPFTLSTYLIDGKTPNSLKHIFKFIKNNPEGWNILQDKLSDFIVDYAIAQSNAGVSAIQLFDSWAGFLSPTQFDNLVVPTVSNIIKRIKEKINTPIVYFSTGTSGYFDIISKIPADGFSIDWRSNIAKSHETLGKNKMIQGNLDPEILALDLERTILEVRSILNLTQNNDRHIFNLGHGILPHTPIENVTAVLNEIRNFK
jgi:uroporphyrinogen decarboxylase